MSDHKQFPGAGKSRPGFFYGYVIVAAAFLIAVAMYGTYFTYGVFLKPVIAEFGWSTASVSAAFAISMCFHGFLGIFMGHFSDRFGPRKVLLLCGFFLGLAYLLMPRVTTEWQLYLCYGGLVGVGLSGGWVCLLSTIARWFTTRRSLMCGFVLSGTGIGSFLLAPVSSWLIDSYGWRNAFVFEGIFVLVVIMGSSFLMVRGPAQKGLQPYGSTTGTATTAAPHATSGLTLRKVTLTRQFWLTFGIFFCFGTTMFAVNIHLVPFAQDLGLSPGVAASLLSVVGAASIFGRTIMGGVADKIGNRQAVLICFSLLTVSQGLFLVYHQLWLLYVGAAIFGFGYAGLGVSESPFLVWLFGIKNHGVILGIIDFGFTLGASLGPVLAGYIFDVTRSYYLAFLFAGISSLVGILLTLAINKRHLPPETALA